METQLDVGTICNALVDLVVKVNDHELVALDLHKGSMNMVSSQKQKSILSHSATKSPIHVELGGSALNTIRALALLGKKTFFGGMIADDPHGNKIKDRLHDLSIKTQLEIATSGNTGTCVVLVTPDHERTMATQLGVSNQFSEHFFDLTHIKSMRIFHFSGYQWDNENQIKTLQRIIPLVKQHGGLISFDLADPFVVKAHRKSFQFLIEEYADIVFANKEEGHLLFGYENPNETLEHLASLNVIAVLKLSQEGALVQKKHVIEKIPALSVKVLDTTGAGDMFAAGFLYGMLNQKSLKTCGIAGATLASHVIQHFGAHLSNHAIEDTHGVIANYS